MPASKTINRERGSVNYGYERQNQWHVTENCTGTGVTMNNVHKT